MKQDLLTREEIEDYLMTYNMVGENPTVLKLCRMAKLYLDTLVDSKTPQGWLIERYKNNQLLFWCGHNPNHFLPDLTKAIRFCRNEDASSVLSWLCEGNGRVAEHLWIKELSSPTLSAKDNKNEL